MEEGKDPALQEQRLSRAVMWLRKAADRGHAKAQYNLAVCMLRGTGEEAGGFEQQGCECDHDRDGGRSGARYAAVAEGGRQQQCSGDVSTRNDVGRTAGGGPGAGGEGEEVGDSKSPCEVGGSWPGSGPDETCGVLQGGSLRAASKYWGKRPVDGRSSFSGGRRGERRGGE
eukprot:747233-Hanusia_phi.AAC.1